MDKRVLRAVSGPVVAGAMVLPLVTGGPATAAPAPAASATVTAPSPRTPTGLPAGIEDLAPYVKANSCDVSDKPGTIALGQYLVATYPTSSYGVSRSCGTDAMATSEHYDGRAVDWMTSVRVPQQRADAQAVLKWLLSTDAAGNTYANARRLGVMYLIWDNKIWTAQWPSGGWQSYQGCDTPAKAARAYDTSCHRDHIHVSLSWAGAMKRTSFWTKQVAAIDYGTCREPDLNWAAPYSKPRANPCPVYPRVTPEPGSSALHASLVTWSGMTVRLWSTGPVVKLVQTVVGASRVDGVFGPGTQGKLKAFQTSHRLGADGVVGPATWRVLLAQTAPDAAAPITAEPPKPAPPKPAPPKAAPPKGAYSRYANVVLRHGSRGTAVKVLQKALGRRLVADGIFGARTAAAVRAFQKTKHLRVDGVVTRPVWRALG